MRTLLIHGSEPTPSALRDLVQRGSTSVDEISAGDLSTFVSREALGVDRLVFWAGRSDPQIRTLAWNYATVEGTERMSTVVYVTSTPSEDLIDGMTREEIFVWPRDEDKLKLIFTTGG